MMCCSEAGTGGALFTRAAELQLETEVITKQFKGVCGRKKSPLITRFKPVVLSSRHRVTVTL